MYYYGKKQVNDWLNDEKREEGVNKLNVIYLREFKGLDKELAKMSTLAYFLLTKLDMQEVRTMMQSVRKQRNLVFAICNDLKKYKVPKDYKTIFDLDVKKIQDRVDYVFKMLKENLRFTEYFPFFEEVGFDVLLKFDTKYSSDYCTPLDGLVDEFTNWKSTHENEIMKHLDSIKEEKEVAEKHRKEVGEKEKEERKKERQEKKKQKEYEDMIIEGELNRLREIRKQKKYDEKHYYNS